MQSISVSELRERLERGDDLLILDVREPEEWEVCRLPNATLIPLGELPHRHHELDRDREIVVQCHHGMRSQYAIDFLQRQGFTKTINLTGGIDAWSRVVDPTVPRY